MAVFRIEKTRDYTVMSNHHLKDRTLTLKSKKYRIIKDGGLQLNIDKNKLLMI